MTETILAVLLLSIGLAALFGIITRLEQRRPGYWWWEKD